MKSLTLSTLPCSQWRRTDNDGVWHKPSEPIGEQLAPVATAMTGLSALWSLTPISRQGIRENLCPGSYAGPAKRYAPDDTRQRILDAAQCLFSARGGDATKTQEIARRAGVSEGSIFYHFGSKQQLLVKASQAFAEAMIATVPRGDHACDIGVAVTGCIHFCLEHRIRSGGSGEGCLVTDDRGTSAFFQSARGSVVQWIGTVIKASRCSTMDVAHAASFTFTVIGASADMVAAAPNEAARAEVVAETVRFLRAATG